MVTTHVQRLIAWRGMVRRRCPYADLLTEEKYYLQSSLLEIFAKPRNEWEFINNNYFNNRIDKLRWWTVSKCEIMDNCTHYIDQLIANAHKPYAAHPPLPPIPSDPFSMIFFPGFDTVQYRYTANQTQTDLLLVALALQAYHAEHGVYPATLTVLTPGYLSAIPADPFALSGPFRYRRTSSGYALYSVGPDGKDDGGTASADGRRKKGGKPLSSSSTGDIVAGVNVQ